MIEMMKKTTIEHHWTQFEGFVLRQKMSFGGEVMGLIPTLVEPLVEGTKRYKESKKCTERIIDSDQDETLKSKSRGLL